MSKTKFARISITIPADVLKTADRLARQLDRSRSWVLSEGVRRMGTDRVAPAVAETRVSPYAGHEAEMQAVAIRRLQADLASSPAERLRQAEALARLGRRARPARSRSQVIAFDSYEDFHRWKTTHQAGG